MDAVTPCPRCHAPGGFHDDPCYSYDPPPDLVYRRPDAADVWRNPAGEPLPARTE